MIVCLTLKNNVTIIEPDNYLIRNDNCIGSFTPFGALDIAKLSLALIEKSIEKMILM